MNRLVLIFLLLSSFCACATRSDKTKAPVIYVHQDEVQSFLLPANFINSTQNNKHILKAEGFSIMLPAGSEVWTQYAAHPEEGKDGRLQINISNEVIEDIQLADGVCGTSDKDISRRNLLIYPSAKYPADAIKILKANTNSILYGEVIGHNPKLIVGLSECEGDWYGEEPPRLEEVRGHVLFFHDGRQLELHIPMPVKSEIKLNQLKEIESFVKDIGNSNVSDTTASQWKKLKEIFSTIQLLD